MRVSAVVEIVPDARGELPSALIAAAYQASRGGIVMFVLNGANAAGVDRLLDPIVRRHGIGMLGILYAKIEDEPTVFAAAQKASFVIAASANFREMLKARGITSHMPHATSARWLSQIGLADYIEEVAPLAS